MPALCQRERSGTILPGHDGVAPLVNEAGPPDVQKRACESSAHHDPHCQEAPRAVVHLPVTLSPRRTARLFPSGGQATLDAPPGHANEFVSVLPVLGDAADSPFKRNADQSGAEVIGMLWEVPQSSNKNNGFSRSSSPPASLGTERQFKLEKPLVFSVG